MEFRHEGAHCVGWFIELVHSVKSTAANAADVTHAADLLRGEETRVFGDAGDTGAE